MSDYSKAFTRIELTEQEEMQGFLVSGATKAVIINLRADYAGDLLADCLRYKCGSEEEKIEQSYKKGALDALTYLLERISGVMGDKELQEIAEAAKLTQPEV